MLFDGNDNSRCLCRTMLSSRLIDFDSWFETAHRTVYRLVVRNVKYVISVDTVRTMNLMNQESRLQAWRYRYRYGTYSHNLPVSGVCIDCNSNQSINTYYYYYYCITSLQAKRKHLPSLQMSLLTFVEQRIFTNDGSISCGTMPIILWGCHDVILCWSCFVILVFGT